MLCRIVVAAVLASNILYVQCAPGKIDHPIVQKPNNQSGNAQRAKRDVLGSNGENQENAAIKLTNLLYKGGEALKSEENLRQTRQNQVQSNTQLQYNEASEQSSSKSSNVVVNQNHLKSAGNGVVGIAQPYAAAPVQYGNVHTGINKASSSTSQSTSQNVYSQKSSSSHANSNVVGSGVTQARYIPKTVQNGDYHFGYTIDDDIRGGYNERQEQSKDGRVSGYYTYDDGHVWRKVVYEADEFGFRVLSDDILPSKKVEQHLTGVAYVKNHSGDGSYQYAVAIDETPDARF